MNMTVDEMKALAAKNTKAFLSLMDMDGTSKVSESSSLLGGGQRSEGVEIKGAETRNSAYSTMINGSSRLLSASTALLTSSS